MPFQGLKRFDEYQQSLGISPTMLTCRLHYLVSQEMLFRRPYQDRPLRYDYLLTERGNAFSRC